MSAAPKTAAAGASLRPRDFGDADVAVMTVLQVELAAVRDALAIPESAREKDEDGTITWRGSVRSKLLGRDYRVVVVCIGAAGNPGAAAAVSSILATRAPRAVMLVGIAAGLRGKVKIGEVVLSDRVIAYEPAAIVAGADGGPSEERRPEIDRTAHAMSQDIVSYRADASRIEEIFSRIGGRFPGEDSDFSADLREHIASSIAVRTGTMASGEKLLRHPDKLREVREEIHGKAYVGEMEAAGVVEACRRGNVPWLILRGISDFGDERKDDRFQDLAARTAAAVLADFLVHGLDIGVAPARVRPTPSYPDEKTRRLSEELDEARERQRKLREKGVDTGVVDREIQSLRREMREGGQLRAGDSLGDGRYLLLDQIGRGGFSIVWKAHDGERGVDVAIKVLHTELAGDPVRRERFFRGARRMMDLDGDGVVRVLDPHGEDGGYHYFVMELVLGSDLRRAVIDKRLSAESVIPVILRVGGALARAHARGLIHRDIKPANILLDVSGSPWLTDFDLVGGAADSTGGTRTDAALGTVGYAAPELLLNATKAGPRADVYGLGMTTLFALYGAELRSLFVHGARKIIDELGCSAAIKGVVARAVAVEEEERFADAGEYCKALQEAWSLPLAVTGADTGADTGTDTDTDTGAGADAGAGADTAPDTVRTRRREDTPGVDGALAGKVDRSLYKVVERMRNQDSGDQASSPWAGSRRAMTQVPRDRWWQSWRILFLAGLVLCGLVIAASKVLEHSGTGISSPPAMLASGASFASISSIAPALSFAVSVPPAAAPSTSVRSSRSCPRGMALIPASTFMMGSSGGKGDADEEPPHLVALSRYYCLDQTEVTVEEYSRCVNDEKALSCIPTPAGVDGSCNAGRTERAQHPVNCITWEQARRYCAWIGKRLPTEAEWELAARGERALKYPWGPETPSNQACWNGSGNDSGLRKRSGTCRVGQFKGGASPFGVLDMAGNVEEWTADWYDEYSASSSALVDPRGPSDPKKEYRVARGGGWNIEGASSLRAANRTWYAPETRANHLGVRCALTPDE